MLWYFLGFFGAHRFYVGRIGSAIAQLVLTITLVGMLVTGIWWIVDAFLTHRLVKDKNLAVEASILGEITAVKPA